MTAMPTLRSTTGFALLVALLAAASCVRRTQRPCPPACLSVAPVPGPQAGLREPAQPAREDLIAGLRRALADPDRGVRYAAVIALGKAGVQPDVLAPLVEDPEWCVRMEARWWQARLRESGRGANQLSDYDDTVPVRARATLSTTETNRQLVRLRSPERDTRIAAARALAGGTAPATPALLEALEDANWRVRTEAARSLGLRRAGAAALGPLLRSANVPLAQAAFRALCANGADAAVPTARAMQDAHYGALHWGTRVFERLGVDGATAVPLLRRMLAHEDVTAREVGARCLREIGPSARAAAPALVRALGDPRLCVISHASLALGAIGPTPELVDALSHAHARVRAYAAFALGWALGAARRVDQVPYEVRLPVLDVPSDVDVPDGDEVANALAAEGGPEPALLRRAIWSRDPAVAVPAAKALQYEMVGARDSERAMELLLPEGLRKGLADKNNPTVDFDNMRWILGSAEVPAFLAYFIHADLDVKTREYVCGNLHRLALPWHIPALYWFERNHGKDSVEGMEELWFSEGYSDKHARLRVMMALGEDPGPDLRDIVRYVVDAEIAEPKWGFGPLVLWPLARMPFRDSDAAWMRKAVTALADADDAARPSSRHYAPGALMRAMGELRDDESLAFLRVRWREDEDEQAPLGLVLGGDPEALASLKDSATRKSDDLLWLLGTDPARGAALLAAQLTSTDAEARALARLDEWSEEATILGIRFEVDSFLGVEAVVAASDLPASEILEIARTVPLCNTRRLLQMVLERWEAPGGFPTYDEEEGYNPIDPCYVLPKVARMELAFPTRVRALMRKTLQSGDLYQRALAAVVLTRLGDAASRGAVLEYLRGAVSEYMRETDTGLSGLELPLRRLPGADTRAFLRSIATDASLERWDRDWALAELACLQGLGGDDLDLLLHHDWEHGEGTPIERISAAVLENRMDVARQEIRAELARQGSGTAQVDLLRRTQAGDRHARAELWSMLRAGRYGTAHYQVDGIHRLDNDLAVLPHWLHELESNCCRVSDGMEVNAFEEWLGAPTFYGSDANGYGRSLSARALEWLQLMGGHYAWSRLADRYVQVPE